MSFKEILMLIMNNMIGIVWTLFFFLIYGVFFWGIYDKNDKLVSFIAMISPTIILIMWIINVILLWNNGELMLKLMKN